MAKKKASSKTGPVTVEYDFGAHGKRATKTFDDPYEARTFYVAKDKAGKAPKVVGGEVPPADKPDTKPAPAAAPAPAEDAAKVDALGSRHGTKAALINAALTDTPKRMKQLMEEAGVDETFYNHLNKLAAAGKVVKTAEGFRLA